MEQITTIGLDLAKNVFQIHAINAEGAAVVRRRLRRSQVQSFFASLEPCLVGMEACGTAHFWARELAAFGHEVRVMPPSYVKPYVRRGKNDAVDAEAICEAVTRPNMRFVPVKTEDQQAVLMFHKTRELLVRQQNMLVNALRAHMAEFGMIAAKGRGKIEAWHESNEASRRLATIPGVGILTAAAIAAMVPDPSFFRSGREFAAWLGLVPKQNSSGGKEHLGRISKKGNRYIRTLLVIGATAVLHRVRAKNGPMAAWVNSLLERRPARLVTVAMANKTARIAWALLARQEVYREPLMA